MEFEKIVRINLGSEVEREMSPELFFGWVKAFTRGEVKGDKITKGLLDKLSAYTEEIGFSEDHQTLYVNYYDDDEAEEDEIARREENISEPILPPDDNAAYPDAFGDTTWRG